MVERGRTVVERGRTVVERGRTVVERGRAVVERFSKSKAFKKSTIDLFLGGGQTGHFGSWGAALNAPWISQCFLRRSGELWFFYYG